MILKNSNAEPLIKWIFRKEDKLDSLVFFFISKSNAMNARYLPLFDSTKSIRIVYFKGVGLRYSDRIIIFLYVNIIKLFKRKVNSYKIIHLFNPLFKVKNQVQILHLDDPEYSDSEIENIRLWEKYVNNIQAKSAVICTNTFTQKWLSKNLIYSDIIIIEQGFHKLETSLIKLEG
jgi:hypothetical protein